MFGIMLTRNIQGDDPNSALSVWKLPGLAAALLVFLVLAYGISSQRPLPNQKSWATMDTRPPIGPVKEDAVSDRSAAIGNMARVVGNELMTRYMIAFEVAGLLLTAALVGAIAIAHREEIEPAAGRPARRSSPAGASPSGNGPEAPSLVAQPAEGAEAR